MTIDIINQVLIALVLAGWLLANGIVAYLYDTELMKEEFIDDQNFMGKIFANAFYAIAWLLKGIKWLVNKYIA